MGSGAWRELVQRAEWEEWSYRDFLALLVTDEIAQRQQTRIAGMVRRARFPFLKTIDDFNFLHQSTLRLSRLGSALAPDFVTEGRCLILVGKPGRGKTHLAVAIAYRAIPNGFDALFVTAAGVSPTPSPATLTPPSSFATRSHTCDPSRTGPSQPTSRGSAR